LSGRRAKKSIHDGSQKNELNGYKDFCKTARNEGMTPVVKILSESDKY
jgi:hypothetical protein